MPPASTARWEPTDEEDRFAVRLGMRMVRGFANAHAAALVSARADDPYASIDDLWRRAHVPAASLVQLAEADAFRPSLKLARREALWTIKALRDEPLPSLRRLPFAKPRPSRNSMSHP
jgi:error-prone DNA polymerase